MRIIYIYIVCLLIVTFSLLGCRGTTDFTDENRPPVHSKRILISYIVSSNEFLPNGHPGADIFINQHLSDMHDYGMCFGNKSNTINQNFDFKSLYLLTGGNEQISFYGDPCQYLAGHDTDYIVAMRLCATHNVNGDFDTSDKFTGGFHGYNSETSGNFSPTMYEISKKVYADGVELLPNTSVYADSVKVIVENLIQGSNTEKIDGTGRYIMKQVIILTCSGEDYNIDINLIPLEDVLLYQVNGLCFYNDFDMIQFLGSEKDNNAYNKAQVVRADKNVYAIRQFNSKYYFDVFMDLKYGLGTCNFNDDSYNASSESANKSYFNLISKRDGVLVPKDSVVSFRGGYRFGINTTN